MAVFLGDGMGVANPRDRVYPEISYVQYATAWDPLSDPLIVLVCSPCLTDCVKSPRGHRFAGGRWTAGKARPANRSVSRRDGNGDQNLGGGAWIVSNGSGSGPRKAFRLLVRVKCHDGSGSNSES